VVWFLARKIDCKRRKDGAATNLFPLNQGIISPVKRQLADIVCDNHLDWATRLTRKQNNDKNFGNL